MVWNLTVYLIFLSGHGRAQDATRGGHRGGAAAVHLPGALEPGSRPPARCPTLPHQPGSLLLASPPKGMTNSSVILKESPR